MKQVMLMVLVGTVVFLAMQSIPAVAVADEDLEAKLQGFKEVPAISTTGSGRFRAEISKDETSIEYKLSYKNIEGIATAAHIHLGQRDVNGGIIAFLCGGEGKPACPAHAGTVEGKILAIDIIGPEGQGIAPEEFAEVLRAIETGVTYVNVHSTKHPPGEIRGQVKD